MIDARKTIGEERKDLEYLIENFGERVREMCADRRTENLLEYIDRNVELVQFMRLEFEEAFIALLLTA